MYKRQGLAAGVTVTSSSGQPGAAAQIRVRGIGTVNNSDPLYIVDGMPLEGGLDYLNPNDIASVSYTHLKNSSDSPTSPIRIILLKRNILADVLKCCVSTI